MLYALLSYLGLSIAVGAVLGLLIRRRKVRFEPRRDHRER